MLGVCYYPEHWPQDLWATDAARMKALGLTYVRIGEFAWSRIEPSPGTFDFAWMDSAIETLGAAGLKVVIGTPTATPPKWLIDLHPEILPVDPATGRTRGFGSRRHYDFSSKIYRTHSARITTALAERYGAHPAVVGWQTDNELCCHDTTLSASAAACDAFRTWCADRYGDIATLNAVWGNVFWSMEYRDFSEIELPVGAVTETSHAHRLAWRRFASDEVAQFHDEQVAILRRLSPGRFVTHNFIPMNETGVDNHRLARDLDFAAYDNYPLGRTDLWMKHAEPSEFRPWMRTGHPDFSSFFFDQTRGLNNRPFWIMEQQPGPVNWAMHNPRPAPGMVRLWSLEAFAHGAAVVSYFRWRQVPVAQEQMHAGLLRPDNTEAEAWPEVLRVVADIAQLGCADLPIAQAPVALVVDVEAQWLGDIERQGSSYDYTQILLQHYRALRSLGLDVDFIAPDADATGYALVIVPALAIARPGQAARLAQSGALVLFGPRSGAKTEDFALPAGLAPGLLREAVPVRVLAVETLRPGCEGTITRGNREHASGRWRESIEAPGADVLGRYEDGSVAMVRRGRCYYLATLTDDTFLLELYEDMAAEAGVATVRLPETLRLRRRGDLVFAINYGAKAMPAPAPAGATFVLGGPTVGARDCSVWRA
eukprot:gene6443-6510_t